MRKMIKKLSVYILMVCMLAALAACGEISQPTEAPTATSAATYTPTPTSAPTATPSPTSTPSPTPSQTPKEQLIGLAATGVENAVYYLQDTPFYSNEYIELYELGGNLLIFESTESSYSSETSDYSIKVYDIEKRECLPGITLPGRMQVSVSQIDENHILLAERDSETYTIYDEKLQPIAQMDMADYPIYSEIFVDLESHLLYFCSNYDVYEYDYQTRKHNIIYSFDKEVYFEYLELDEGILTLNGYFLESDEEIGFSRCFVELDVEQNTIVSVDEQCVQYFFSEDGSEYLYADVYKNCYLALYETEGDKLVQRIKFVDSNEAYCAFIDWKNRAVVTRSTVETGKGYYNELRCYSIDTGEVISDCLVKKYGDFLDRPICMESIDMFVLPGACEQYIEEEDYFYRENELGLFFWDYMNDGVESKDYVFERQSSINQTFSEPVERLRKEIEENYGINVYLGYEILPVEFTYRLDVCNDEYFIYSTLSVVNKVFSSYPKGFFEQLKCGMVRTLGVYLCDGFTKLDDYSAENAIALATYSNYERILALDVNYTDEMEATVYHEVSHWIDTIIADAEAIGEISGYSEGWEALNPEDFDYLNRYNDYYDNLAYTVYWGIATEDAYFTDAYSTTFAGEDRARLFENLMCDEYNDYWQSEHMIKKLEFQFEAIRKAFNTEDWPEKTSWEERLEIWKNLNSNYHENENGKG